MPLFFKKSIIFLLLAALTLIAGGAFYIFKPNIEVSATEGEAINERTFALRGSEKIGQIAISPRATDREALDLLGAFGVTEEPRDNMRHGNILVFEIAEVDHGADLNGDGDFSDEIIGWLNLATGEVFSSNITGRYPVVRGNEIGFFTHEWQIHEDLNGDGDQDDAVMRFYNFVSNRVLNSRTPGESEGIDIDRDGFIRYDAVDGVKRKYKVPVEVAKNPSEQDSTTKDKKKKQTNKEKKGVAQTISITDAIQEITPISAPDNMVEETATTTEGEETSTTTTTGESATTTISSATSTPGPTSTSTPVSTASTSTPSQLKI